MQTVQARMLNSKDCYICRIFLVFMLTPLLLVLTAGAAIAD
jgi:hypothetical protein